ncbi:hypothetical protein [uncultured Moraxella sp.]|uniref:hypothetical protein n=1 Tax=uncultured Moraxella sp. TaxID=263769 RepID=UPI0025EA120D|nr:hypothetical protein [uncultured Moraxella sp.]
MPPRQKSKLERWFSFSRHQRRFGADIVTQALDGQDIESMKATLITGDDTIYTYGSAKDLQTHINDLRQEFVGLPTLCHYHASLIVLIRREIDTEANFQKFKALWLAERDFLLQHLNTRWLISACDTFIDHDEDATLQAILMNANILINTIKLQETERLLCQATDIEHDDVRQRLQTERVALFDGTAAFAVGTDDSLRNMRWRLDKVCAHHPLGQIVIEIFDRLQLAEHDTVYSRFRARHTRERTRWW